MTQEKRNFWRKAIGGLIIEDEISRKVKGCVDVHWDGNDCTISVSRKGNKIFELVYPDLGSFITSPYFMDSDLDLVADDVINNFTESLYQTFFKNFD